MVTYDGLTMSIKDHARRLKIPYSRLRSRIARHGVTAAAFAAPARKRGTPEEIEARRDAASLRSSKINNP